MVGRGLEFRRKGRDTEALAEFQHAFQLRPAPRIQAQIALAEQALGLWVDAEEDLLGATEHRDDDWIRKNHSRLNEALGVIQKHLGTLEIWGSPKGAEILVNEKKAGTLPLAKAIRVSGESAILRARAPGFSETSRSVRVLAGERVREHIELVPEVGTPPRSAAAERAQTDSRTVDPGAGVAPVASANAAATPAAPEEDDAPTPSPSGLRPYAWAVGVLAVAGVGFGVVETLAVFSKRSEFAEHLGPNPDNPSQTILDCGTANLTSDCQRIQDAYHRSLTLSIIGYGVGGALAIGSAVLFVLSSKDAHPAPTETTALACVADPLSRGVACHMTF